MRVPGIHTVIGCVLALSPGMALTQQVPHVQQTPQAHEHHELKVLYRGTPTVSSQRYLSKLRQAEHQKSEALAQAQDALRQMPKPPAGSLGLSNFFPLKPLRLRIGEAQRKRIDLLSVPMFVIGMDPASLKWFSESFDELKAIGAQGIVVEAESFPAFDALRRKALSRGVAIDAAPGDPMAEAFGFTTYPILLVGKP